MFRFNLHVMVRFLRFFLLFICTGGVLAQCRQKAEQSIYLLPNHFVGNVLIIFGQPVGAPAEYRGSARLYRVPVSGVLHTQFKPNYGFHQPDQYYYIDGQGRKSKSLLYADDLRKINPNRFSGDTICFYNAPATDSSIPKVHYTAFAVGRIEQLDSIRQLQDAMILKLASEK